MPTLCNRELPRVQTLMLLEAAPSSHTIKRLFTNQTLQGNKHWFEVAVKRAGIRDFHWHDLRHTFGSRLAMAGVGRRTIQELMGHKTIQMTCRYAQLSPQHQLAAVEKLCDQRASTDTMASTRHFGRREPERCEITASQLECWI